MARALIDDGIPGERLHSVRFPGFERDRTYGAALVVRQWCRDHGISVKSLNVITCGPHARRSRLLYGKAFGGEVAVGVVAISSHAYDPAHWWRTSEGAREVLGETIAYLHARLSFRQ